MSTPFYDLASLVVVPSGYKASKVYAQKPLTTDGQLTFSRASTATRVNSAGLIETVSSNVPRLDYLGSTCPKLQLEPQRSNLVLNSSQMTLWANGAASVTADQAVSPDGTQNADRINNTADVSTFVSASNGVYTFSLFVKQGTSATASIDMSDGATGDVITTFTFATKTFSGTSAGGSWTSPSTAYQDYGNGWYRISLTATKGAGSTIGHKIIASGTGTTFVWGAQLEAGAYATSYIPTLGAAVTRGADACSKTGISSLIGQTEGTVYVKFKFNAKQGMAFQIATSSGYENAIYLERITDSFMAVQCWVSGVQQVSILLGGMVDGQTYSVAVAYKANDFAVYRDGVLVDIDTSASLPASFNNFYLGNFGGAAGYETTINQALLFKTRLTNAQLAELTAL